MDQPAHYKFHYTRDLTKDEVQSGKVTIKLDPYRICDIYDVGGGAREQIIKKGLRWTTKGDSEEKVIKEIMQACQRRLEMLEEDKLINKNLDNLSKAMIADLIVNSNPPGTTFTNPSTWNRSIE